MRKVAAQSRVGKIVKVEWKIVHSIDLVEDPLSVDVEVDYMRGESDELFVRLRRKDYKGKQMLIWSISSFETAKVFEDKRFRAFIKDVLDEDAKDASAAFRKAIIAVATNAHLWAPPKLQAPSETVVHSAVWPLDG